MHRQIGSAGNGIGHRALTGIARLAVGGAGDHAFEIAETRFEILAPSCGCAVRCDLFREPLHLQAKRSQRPALIVAAGIVVINRVARGERVVSANVRRLLAQADAEGDERLTARERQILEGITRGMSNAAMAAALGISPKTVDSHRTSLMRKLDANSAPALVLAAIRRGLIDSSSSR